MAVVPPNLQVGRSIRVNADSRSDQDVAVGRRVAADEPALCRLEHHPSRADVVRLKDLRRHGRSRQDQRGKRAVPRAAISVGILPERLPHVRAKGVQSDGCRGRAIRSETNGIAAVESAALDGQSAAGGQVDAGHIRRGSDHRLEEVDRPQRDGTRSASGRDDAMADTALSGTRPAAVPSADSLRLP